MPSRLACAALRQRPACACGKPFTAAWSRGKSGKPFGYYWCNRCRPRGLVSKRDLESAFVELLARGVIDVWQRADPA
jgi:hypothetical protein